MNRLRCPACEGEMGDSDVHGSQVDVCKRCRGIFLDAHELPMAGHEPSAFFGYAAQAVGVSNRRCPRHGEAMTTYRAQTAERGALEVERAGCCGGVFFDAGEIATMRATPAASPPKPFTPAGPLPVGPAQVASAAGSFVAPPPKPAVTAELDSWKREDRTKKAYEAALEADKERQASRPTDPADRPLAKFLHGVGVAITRVGWALSEDDDYRRRRRRW